MRRLIAITLCAIMALSFTACGSKSNSPSNQSSAVSSSNSSTKIGEGSVQIPNPFVECKTIADAEKIAGFKIAVPEKMPEGYQQHAILAIENDLIEIDYVNGKDEITIRKGKGSEDISGDYNSYKETNTLTVGNLQITTKGEGGKVNVATWVDGDYSFAANMSEKGIDIEILSDMINSIK